MLEKFACSSHFFFLILHWNFDVSKTATLKQCANGRNNLNIVGPTVLGVVVAKRLTGFKLFATTPNNTQQHATNNRVCKRTQHVTSSNVESCSKGLGQLIIRSHVAWPDNFNLHCVILWNVRVFHFLATTETNCTSRFPVIPRNSQTKSKTLRHLPYIEVTRHDVSV